MTARTRASAALVLLVTALAAVGTGMTAATAAAWDVTALMQGLAAQKGGKVLFTEQKHIALLDRPVESSGELLYQPPARLEKRTLQPQAESLVLDGDVLVVERGRKKYSLQLSQYPEIAAIVGTLRSALAGDLGALGRDYRVDLQGTQDRWTLWLLPSDTKIAAIVQRIRVSGTQSELREIEMLQADGDRSVMQIRHRVPP